MDSDKQFEHLAQRETELRALANRGRRRALLIMIIAFLPIPFVLMKINDDRSLAGMIPIAIACVCRGDLVLLDEVAASARRLPVSRIRRTHGKRRWETCRSLLRGSRIDDAVVLTIVETIHRRLRRSVMVIVAAMEAVTIATIALVMTADDSVSPWVPVAIVVLSVGAIA